MPKRSSDILVPILLVTLVVATFGQTLRYGFVYDDFRQVVVAAPVLGDWSLANLRRAVGTDVWTFFTWHAPLQDRLQSVYYRPVFSLFAMVGYALAGLTAWKWHLILIVLHATAAVLAYHVGFATFGSTVASTRILAGIAASIFAVHPAQTESVAWISSFVNPLSAIWTFGLVAAHLQSRSSPGKMVRRLVALGCYLLALLTKEVSVTLPALLFFYEITVTDGPPGWRRLRNGLRACLPYLLVALVYFLLRRSLLPANAPLVSDPDFPKLHPVSPGIALLTAPAVLVEYLKLTVFPFLCGPLHILPYVHFMKSSGFLIPFVLLAGLTITGAIVAKRVPALRIAIVWMVFPLVPVLNISFFRFEELIRDRYLYLPLFGVGLAVAIGLHQLNNLLGRFGTEPPTDLGLRRSIIVVTCTLLATLVAFTIKQNPVWANERSLWEASLAAAPDSCLANQEVGRMYTDAGDYANALACLETARRTCPDSHKVHYQLGGVYLQTRAWTRAREEFTRTLDLAPPIPLAATVFFNLGFISESEGDERAALLYYQKGLDLDPSNEFAPRVREAVARLSRISPTSN